MNILLYDINHIRLEQLKNMLDACKKVSGTSDWIALPKGIDVIQDAPIEWLENIRDGLNKCIEHYKIKEEQK